MPAKVGRGSPLNKSDIMTRDIRQKQALENNLQKLCTAVLMMGAPAPEATGRAEKRAGIHCTTI
jgi:hypothetical protein